MRLESLTLPHHQLIAYQVAAELLRLVARIRITDAELRPQARKAAKSAVRSTAEGAARQTLADKSRAYAIALAEGCECCAAIVLTPDPRYCFRRRRAPVAREPPAPPW